MTIDWGGVPPPPEQPPDSDVWNYLRIGLDLARQELDALPLITRDLAEAVAKEVIGSRERLVQTIEGQQFSLDVLLEEPWFKYAADVELATKGLRRATEGLKRYLELKPILTQYRVPERATPYIRTLSETFVFGFDAPCIAFAGAALEQVLKDALIEAGEYTEPRIRRERPTGETLVAAARRRSLIRETELDAKKLFDQRNRTMHRHIWDDKIITGIAIECIDGFSRVVQELGTTLGQE
jgi:hypothetical protein